MRPPFPAILIAATVFLGLANQSKTYPSDLQPAAAQERFISVCESPDSHPGEAILIQKLGNYFASLTWLEPKFDGRCESIHRILGNASTIELHFDPLLDQGVDFSLLAQAKNLSYLNLEGIRPEDLGSLPDMPRIERLQIIGDHGNRQSISADVSFVGAMPKLQWLELRNLGIKDLSPLKSIKNLETLILAGNQIDDAQLEYISDLQVWHLDLSENPITNFEKIPRSEYLERLSLRNTGISELGDLLAYPNLFELDLRQTPFSESPSRLRALWDASNLEILNDWSPFLEVCRDLPNRPESRETIRALHWYDVDDPEMDIKDRTQLPSPEDCLFDARRLSRYDGMTLDFQRTDRTRQDLSALAGFKRLGSLTLRNHMGTDFSPLSELKNLEYLGIDRGEDNDLDYTQFPEIPEGFHPLAKLKSLRSISARRCGIRDLAPLAELDNLETLDISENEISGDQLMHLGALKRLRAVDLSFNPLGTSAHLPLLPNLEQFKARSSRLKSLEGMTGQSALIEVDLAKNEIKSLQGLSDSIQLQIVDVSENLIQDLAPLARMTEIQTLIAQGNRVDELGPLRNLLGLENLNLSYNRIENLEPISGLTRLTHLDLSGNALRDLGTLAKLSELESLSLNRCRIRNITALSGLKKLTQLELANNLIDSMSADAKFVALEYLNLSQNSLKGLDPILRFASLKQLKLNRNRISALPTQIKQLQNLWELDLSDNQIQDAAPVLALEQLQILKLARNRLEDFPMCSRAKFFEELDVQGNQISDASPFARLLSYKLNLADNRISDILPLQGIFSGIILKTLNVDMTTQFFEVQLQGNPISDFTPLIENLPRKSRKKSEPLDDSERYLYSDYQRRFSRVTISQGNLTSEQVDHLRAQTPFDFLTVLP